MIQTIGERIRATREQRGMTQVRLAALVGINPVTLWRIETNAQNPSTETITDIAHHLGMTTDYLLNGGIQMFKTPPMTATETLVFLTFAQAVAWGDPDSRSAFLDAVEKWKTEFVRPEPPHEQTREALPQSEQQSGADDHTAQGTSDAHRGEQAQA